MDQTRRQTTNSHAGSQQAILEMSTHNLNHSTSLIDDIRPATISWDNINVYLQPPDRMCCRGPDPNVSQKQILNNVRGLVKPGTLLAIMGASGSGKTTLLNTLTSRNHVKLKTNGNIRVNGIDVGNGIRNISAYVQQDDLFIATMTVREHLQFRARLHMDKAISAKRRMQRVEEVIQELGLTKCADNIIGNPERMKGISGGEMRRLSFASEILPNPPILFCDEPTSGLDSFMAANIVQTLKDMAHKGRTILCTIHQPSSDVYELFDQVLIMAEGRVAYLGELQAALKYFANAGYPCPTNYNPADFFIMTLAVVPGKENEGKEKVKKICDHFEQSGEFRDIVSESEKIVRTGSKSDPIFEEASNQSSRYESSWGTQFSALFGRCWMTNWREPAVLKVRVAQTIIIALLLGLIFLRLEVNQRGVMDINGLIFLFLTNITFTNIFAVINVFPHELPIFLREYGIGLYDVNVYFLCKMAAELIWFIIIPILFTSITYWMTGLYETFEAFAICCGVLILVANCSASFGYLISACANHVGTVLALTPPLLVPLLMFGGFVLNTESIPVYFIWAEYLSWFKYGYEMLAVNQWQNIGEISCEGDSNSTQCLFRSGEAVLKYMNLEKDNMYIDLGALFALLIGLRIIAFIVLVIKAKRSRA